MPGIVGLITKIPRHEAEGQLQKMVDSLRHETFYTTGTWVDEALGIYVGWVSRHPSFSGEQPLLNEKKDVALIFSGEEYAEPGTTDRLRSRGHVIDVNESSYLVHLYEENPDFIANLNGFFHGLLVDRSRREAVLFNDRYGMARLYTHESNEAFYFAAEAKAILSARPELRVPDYEGLGEFASYSCILENRTIFKDIGLLPGGSAWKIRGGAVAEKRKYFRPSEWEEQTPLSAEEYYKQLKNVISQTMPRYFRGPEKIGMTLTGGFDTRVVMSWHKPQPNSIPCYTFGGIFRDCEDVKLAKKVAKVCRQSHEVITVGSEFLSQFPQYAERSMYIAEGNSDVYRTSDLYVSMKARSIAPAKVVGTYGSEILRHAVMFKPSISTESLYKPEFSTYIAKAQQTYGLVRNQHPVTFAAFRQSPWYHYGILTLEQSQLSVRTPFMDNDFVKTAYRAPKDVDDDIRIRLIRDGNPALARIRTDRGINGRPSIASAVSRRVLDFTLKAEYAYDYGMPQWLAQIDRLFSSLHLERLFLGRHRLLHYRIWYRNELSGYIRGILLDPRALARPYVERKAVESIVNYHIAGKRNYTSEIHKLLSLELLHRLFFDGQ